MTRPARADELEAGDKLASAAIDFYILLAGCDFSAQEKILLLPGLLADLAKAVRTYRLARGLAPPNLKEVSRGR